MGADPVYDVKNPIKFVVMTVSLLLQNLAMSTSIAECNFFVRQRTRIATLMPAKQRVVMQMLDELLPEGSTA